MPTLTVNDAAIHVLELNSEAEESVLMIHGMLGNLSQFYLTLAPHIAKHYRVVMYDIKSHGKSARVAHGYDLISLSDDMVALLDELNISAVHLVGFSYGALMALKFAERFPERTKKVVAIEAPPRPESPMKTRGSYEMKDFMAFATTLPEHIVKNFLRSRRQIEHTFTMYAYLFNETTFVNDMNTENEFTEASLRDISANVLLLYGNKSVCLPMAIKLYLELSNPHVIIRNGDHGFFMHYPKEVAADIHQFFWTEQDRAVKSMHMYKHK